MRKLSFLLALMLLPMVAAADAWTELYPQIEKSIVCPTFPDSEFHITKYGAKPTAKPAANQKAINKAIAACNKAGGGKVIVSGGTFETGAIRLLSNVNLVVEEGATLLFAYDPKLYPIVPTRWEGLDINNLSPCIYAYEAKNVALTGKGTVDGGADREGRWWNWCGKDRFGYVAGTPRQQDDNARPRLLRMAEEGVPMDERHFSADDCLRPQLVNFNHCENVLIEDVKLLRSPFWVIHPLFVKNLTVRGVHIENDGPNGDGCDPESCDGVLIENCYFDTGDDCIAVKSGRNNDGRIYNTPTQNVIIRNCQMKNGHGGVVIGSEITGGCRNLFAENCVMDSPNLDRVVRIKTNNCRGGVIENIYVRNIEVGQCGESVLKINLDYEPKEICCRGYNPTVRNVHLDNVTCGKSKFGVMFVGMKEGEPGIDNINVSNCHFNNVEKGNSITGKVGSVNIDNTYLNGRICLYDTPYKNLSQWMASSEIARVPESYMLDFAKKPKWSYVMGIELESILDTYLKYGDDRLRDYCKMYTDKMISPEGEITGYKLLDYNLDNVRTGHFLTSMYRQFPEEKNLIAMKTLMQQLDKQPRTKEGVYWHKAIYAYQVWLDGIFMGLPYRVSTANLLYGENSKKAKKIYDDAVNQLKATYDRTYDPETGLNRHAWDESREMFWSDNESGLSQHCWGRAQGWYTMALVEVLDALPADYARRGEVMDLLEKSLSNVVRYQDADTGVWYQVMDSPDREGNYLESTCSAMMAYSMLKGSRKGYIDQKYRDLGLKAYKGIVDNFVRLNPDKTISLTDCCAVAGLGPGISKQVLKAAPNVKENRRRDGSYQYYLSEEIRDNDAKGLGPFIWASLEAEEMGIDTASLLNATGASKSPIKLDNFGAVIN